MTVHRDYSFDVWTFWGVVFTVALLVLLGREARGGIRWGGVA